MYRPMAHKGTIGNPPRGPGGPPGIFGFGRNPCKTAPWEGLGGNWYTQRVPGYHANHSPLEKSQGTSWGTNPSTKLCFSGPLFGPPKGPGPFLGQDVGSGLQKLAPGSKISKLRVEKLKESTGRCLNQSHHVARDGGQQLAGTTLSHRSSPLPQGRPHGPPNSSGGCSSDATLLQSVDVETLSSPETVLSFSSTGPPG